jgi:hypothetical protein
MVKSGKVKLRVPKKLHGTNVVQLVTPSHDIEWLMSVQHVPDKETLDAQHEQTSLTQHVTNQIFMSDTVMSVFH